ncbi:MAG: phospholipid-binding lipoprotein MlaA, partial [Paraburkholderia sp.]|nr:phospholipid-binding lipoprotein MlaA [Paraburkholderia sp.]
MQTIGIKGVRAVQMATFAIAVTTLVGCSTVQTPTKGDPLEGL